MNNQQLSQKAFLRLQSRHRLKVLKLAYGAVKVPRHDIKAYESQPDPLTAFCEDELRGIGLYCPDVLSVPSFARMMAKGFVKDKGKELEKFLLDGKEVYPDAHTVFVVFHVADQEYFAYTDSREPVIVSVVNKASHLILYHDDQFRIIARLADLLDYIRSFGPWEKSM